MGGLVELDAGVLAAQFIGVELGEGLGGGRVLPHREIKNCDGVSAGLFSHSLGAEPLAGPVETAIPCRGQVAGGLVAAEELGENTHVQLAHLADVVRLVKLVHQWMSIGQQGNRG